MSNTDIVSMCVRNLFKRKLRTFLTMLGVVIGTVAIVVTVSLGLAVDQRFTDMIEAMGDVNIVTVRNPGSRGMFFSPDDDQPQDMEIPDLDTAAARSFENIPGVVSVLPVIETQNLVFRSGPYALGWARVMGVRAQTLGELGYQLQQGRLLQEDSPLEVVFGSQIPLMFEDIFSPWTPARQERWDKIWMGEEVEPFVDIWRDRVQMSYDRSFLWGFETQDQDIDFDDINAPRPIRPFNLEVVGLLERRNDWNVDEVIFMDIDLVQRLNREGERAQQQGGMDWLAMDDGWGGHINARANVQEDRGYDIVYVRVEDLDVVSSVAAQIRAMGLPASYATQEIARLQETAAGQQQMLAAIAAVSFFVAAIGIANTMIMSTYERTREIGVMKVIGAVIKDIRKLFLMEAAMIGFFGGVFGVMLSYLVSYLLNNHSEMAFMGGMMDGALGDGVVSLITPWLSGVALVFAALIGLVSGFLPARRATRLSALNAIRTE